MHTAGTTPVVEQVIHIVLFLLAGLTLGMVALAALERLAAGRRIVRLPYVVVSAALFIAVLAVERLYHASL